MPKNIITTDDLRELKMELLDEIKELLIRQSQCKLNKHLKSTEIMDLLKISRKTLQNLRTNGTLPYTKVGDTFFYDFEDIHKIMNANRVH
ncbi:helix-turn-helix domain-containing protein [Gelidibacter pelagius]|uniref:Helix-turn-helix domain-containing protein n=1 Tax=Gelidibacter pelagius TaxID=2819985 RepID=A0ABS3SQE1_9FLAO|nr:helix-turn-helix domain-containing protein [Gelidibacter pelagius]MBO3097864.1 helix-turn-helix domain-containing protein [Gelidibacter pelagius]